MKNTSTPSVDFDQLKAQLKAELFLQPANEVIVNRFESSDLNAAACTGKCQSGKCKASF